MYGKITRCAIVRGTSITTWGFVRLAMVSLTHAETRLTILPSIFKRQRGPGARKEQGVSKVNRIAAVDPKSHSRLELTKAIDTWTKDEDSD